MDNDERWIEFVSANELRALGAELSVGEVHAAVEQAWEGLRSGAATGGKAVLSLPEDEFWRQPDFAPFRDGFADQRLGWKLSALYSVNARYGAVKIIGANAFNRRLGYPRSTSTIVLMDKYTLRPLSVLDGTNLSAMRTGTYASRFVDGFRARYSRVALFLFGTGPVARSVIECLSYSSADLVADIFVRSRTLDGAQRFVSEMAGRSAIPLQAVADNRRLAECSIVVTASNARQPVFEDAEVAPDAAGLHLGGDEVPEAYLRRVLRTGVVGCDDIGTVSRRNSQSLALYFSRSGLSLETVGPLLGIRELSSSHEWEAAEQGPVSLTCVGLPALDLYVAAACYEKFCAARRERVELR